jgi:hypothetical protein
MWKKVVELIQTKEEIGMSDSSTVDPSGWMVDNSIAQFLLMPTSGIAYMCLFAYAFVHGKKWSL